MLTLETCFERMLCVREILTLSKKCFKTDSWKGNRQEGYGKGKGKGNWKSSTSAEAGWYSRRIVSGTILESAACAIASVFYRHGSGGSTESNSCRRSNV